MGRKPYWVDTCNVVIGKQQKVVDSSFDETDAFTSGHYENKLIVEVGSNATVPEKSFGAHKRNRHVRYIEAAGARYVECFLG